MGLKPPRNQGFFCEYLAQHAFLEKKFEAKVVPR